MNNVTIALLVYNDVEFIEETVNSLLNQTVTPDEILIIDDCSTDGSAEICLKFSNQYSYITYYRNQKNIGISKNMEKAVALAKNKYFAWMGDDDIYEPNFIEELLYALEAEPDSICAFCNYIDIDDYGNKIIEKSYDYSANNFDNQLLKLIANKDDIFGYGLFKRDLIKNVKFPIWIWPNKKVAYNNIFPSLFYYLSRGKYVHVNKVLYKNRMKSKPNHKQPYDHFLIFGFIAYTFRKINLYIEIIKSISFKNLKAPSLILFKLFKKWILTDIYYYAKHRIKFFYRYKIG